MFAIPLLKIEVLFTLISVTGISDDVINPLSFVKSDVFSGMVIVLSICDTSFEPNIAI